jgi:hypothetical protein
MSNNKGRQHKLTDFLLRWRAPRRQSAREQLTIFRALAQKQETRVNHR